MSVRPWEEAGGLFRSVVDAIRDGVAIVDTSGVQSFVNRAFCEMVGYSYGELIGASPPFRYWPEEHTEQLQAVLLAALAGASAEYEVWLQRKDGQRFPALLHTGTISDAGQSIAYVATVKDISERKQMERALGLSEQRWRAIAENPFDFVATIGRDYRFTYVNHAAPGLRVEDVVGKEVFDYVPAEYHAVVRETCERAFRELKPGWYECYVPVVGQWLSTVVGPIVIDGVATGVSLQTRDVTSQKLAEQALRQAQRMEALGRLAGGIAHDFNNLLTPILGNASLVQLELEESHPAQANLVDIVAAAERASELVSRVLVFGREQSPQRRPVRVQDVVLEVVRFMSAAPPANVRLATELEEGCPPVLGAPDELHQVVTNLCTNAMQAVAEKNGGAVTLSVRAVEVPSGTLPLGSASAGSAVAMEPRRSVKLMVVDTGVGIPEAQLTRVFDPFFTTRPVGQGTGLGLSIVQNIVSRYGGSVTLESRLGTGTSVHVVLPACSEPEPTSADAASSVRHPRRVLKLVCIDDDPLVLSWFTRTLERAGHEVRGFSDPREARRYLLAAEANTDCVICDENMPFLTGTALAAQLAQHGDSPPIVLVSGNIAAGAAAPTPNVRARLSKPLAPDVLLSTLARVVGLR